MERQFAMVAGTFPRMALPFLLTARRRMVGASFDPWALAPVPGPRPPRGVLRDGSHVRVGP